ncbi:MAG: AbrB/MazE/SpoVT family DNA-binding domain-containing protein [Candidatus Lokiarchaeota archaeon]|nr:AbrB/MazE/SpoVT family DNA-binding domain-containing protein [Candidatus Lokiarchaeota archaeon]
MNIGKLSKKGQIVIPKEIREKFGIRAGDSVIFKIQGDKVILEKIQEKMSDILTNSEPIEKSLEFQRKIRDEWN